MITAVPSSLQPLSDPSATPEGLTVHADGRLTLFAEGVGGIEIRLSVLDATLIAAGLVEFARRHLSLAEAPPAGQG